MDTTTGVSGRGVWDQLRFETSQSQVEMMGLMHSVWLAWILDEDFQVVQQCVLGLQAFFHNESGDKAFP